MAADTNHLMDIENDRVFIKERIFWGRNYGITNVATNGLQYFSHS